MIIVLDAQRNVMAINPGRGQFKKTRSGRQS